MGFKVYNRPCKNCLMTKNRIVSPERAAEILQSCAQDQVHFVCHKDSMGENEGVCCKKFYDDMGEKIQMIRIAERLNAIEFVEQPDNEKLPTWDEMEGNKK